MAALAAEPDRVILVGAYALGKAQRVIAELRAAGHDAPIFIHGALQRLCDLYRDFGVELGELRLATGLNPATLAGQIVVAPPSALNDRWSHRLPDPITPMACGWMRLRQRARQSNIDLPIVISDNALRPELNATIDATKKEDRWVNH